MGMTYLAITTLPASFKFARNGVYVVAAKKSTSQMDVDEDNQANEAESQEDQQPHRILFVENLPDACNPMMLAMLFQQYDGFVEARLVAGKTGIAFVEFSDSDQAANAKDTLQGFKITNSNHMKITFAKQ